VLTRGTLPDAKVSGGALKIGRQTVRFDGKRIVLGTF
jgi:hypothetical protein